MNGFTGVGILVIGVFTARGIVGFREEKKKSFL